MINMTTPYPEMHRIFWEEFEKCAYWAKRESDKRVFQDAMVAASRSKEDHPRLPVIEYKSKTGNRWRIYSRLMKQRNSIYRGMSYDCICFWDTYGSFGAFVPFRYNGTPNLCIMSGHFWQRLCERTEYSMCGVKTAIDFFNDHVCSKLDIFPPKENDNRNQAIITFNGGAAYGVAVCPELNIYEIRTYLDEKELSGWRKNNYIQAKEYLASDEDRKAWDDIRAIFECHPECDTFGDALIYMTPSSIRFLERLQDKIMEDGNMQEFIDCSLAELKAKGRFKL